MPTAPMTVLQATEFLSDAIVRDGLPDHGAQAAMVGVSRR